MAKTEKPETPRVNVQTQHYHHSGYQPKDSLDTKNPPKGDNFEEKREMVNHPSHYNNYPIEAIDILLKTFGPDKTITFCYMTAMKYRLRLGYKDDLKQDLAKETWYLDKAKELEEKYCIKFTLDEKRD